MSSSPPHHVFLGSRLARRLFALFVVAALVPLALSDWLSTSAVTQIAESLSLRSRAQTTRQTSRQVFDRLMAGKTLLAAMAASTQATETRGPTHRLPGLGLVFRGIAHLSPNGRTAWSTSATDDYAGAWRDGDSGTSEAKVQPGTAGEALEIQLRIKVQADRQPRLLMGARALGVPLWIAELNPEYIWAPVADANDDSAWQVLDAKGRTLTRHAGGDFQPAGEDGVAKAPREDLVESRSRLFLGGEFSAGDWEFIQQAPRPQVLWQGGRLTVWLGLVALGTLLAIAFLSQWQIRRTLTPLLQLTEGTRKLAAGAKGTRVAIGSDDELGTLAGAFNDMATHIEAQFDALEGLAAIDQDILAGAPIERLAERVLQQLAALYPGGRATVSWRDGEMGLLRSRLHDDIGTAPRAVTQRIELAPGQAEAFRQLVRDEQHSTAKERDQSELANAPWLETGHTPATGRLVLLPLRQRDQTQATIAISLAREASGPDQLQPARELRDRLTVAFAARAREQELVYRAVHDSLTGLTNRYGLHGQLEALLADRSATVAVLFLDLDHFKDVNDTRGHEAGDELLCLASARLLARAPADAIVARQGGDEFALVLPNADQARACAIAAEAVEELGRPFALRGGEYLLGASVGIALGPEHGQTREELMRRADIALYAAKAAGRGQYVLFSTALDEAALERVRLLADLRLAVERSEFVAYYQPRVRPEDGRITSAEALIRWRHPTRGLVVPEAFIALAESSGLIDEIGRWILDAACGQIAAWRKDGVELERIAVNVSPHQLESGDLPGQVRAVLERHALPARALELEVTESLLVGDASKACAQLAELRASGITIALDDFGTGYSSMATLRQLPIDVMKIDRSFVCALDIDDSAMAIARAIVALARSLRLNLVAEGIETETQAAVLRSMGCEELQGYFYSKPVAPEDFARLPGLIQG